MKTRPQTKSSKDVFEELAKDPVIRRAVVRESHILFFSIYLRHYIKHPMADFQRHILRTTEDVSIKLACIVAFRGSAKSTLVTLSYAIWATLGIQEKKFVLIICQTQAQARQHMTNLRQELEHNSLLKSDLGPFKEEIGGDWGLSTLVFQNTGARVTVASFEQSIRGIRHREHRPDLIILDDIEDMGSTRTMESRDKTFDWFTREIIPLGDENTRVILVGNLLHEDSLMMRLRKKIEAGEMPGSFQWYPLLDDKGHCLWKEKFNSPQKIESLRQSVASDLAWQQEYLLKVVSDTSRVVFPDWIHTYGAIPQDFSQQVRAVLVGVDLAISQRESADYTTIVTGALYGEGEETKLYILPNPINKRMGFPEATKTIQAVARSLPYKARPLIVIESNGFQELYADQLKGMGLWVKGVKNTTDKRSRLALTSRYIEDGFVQFPKHGAEELIQQITGFGVEHHDDLADAFSTMILMAIEMGYTKRNPVSRGEKQERRRDQGTIVGNIWDRKF